MGGEKVLHTVAGTIKSSVYPEKNNGYRPMRFTLLIRDILAYSAVVEQTLAREDGV